MIPTSSKPCSLPNSSVANASTRKTRPAGLGLNLSPRFSVTLQITASASRADFPETPYLTLAPQFDPAAFETMAFLSASLIRPCATNEAAARAIVETYSP